MLRKMLTGCGYEVSCAEDGHQAIEMYKKRIGAGEAYSAVLIDLTIPGSMGGSEIVNALQNIDPNVKAVITSGYSNDPVMVEYEKYGFVGRIPKPYRTNELYRVFQNVLADPRPDEKNEDIALTP